MSIDTQMRNEWAEMDGERIKELESSLAKCREGIEDLFKMMDEGLLVRDISKDGEAGYAMRALEFVVRLKRAKEALEGSK